MWIGLSVFVVLAGGTVWAVRSTSFTFPPVHTRAFPGFDMSLPYGAVDAEAKNYRKGRLTVSGLASLTPSVDVRWEPGEVYGDAEIALAQKGMAAALREEVLPFPIASEIAIEGKNRARSWAAHVGKRTLWSTQIACGVRRMTLTTLGSRNTERLHRRVAGSFHCRPDAAQERAAAHVPVVFDVGKGWVQQPTSDGDLRITNGRFGLVARPMNSRVDPAEVRRIIEEAMPSFKFGDRVGDDWPFQLDVDGEEEHGWMTARACPGGDSLLLMSFGDADERGQARALLTRARCQRPDESPQIWPDPPAQAKRPDEH